MTQREREGLKTEPDPCIASAAEDYDSHIFASVTEEGGHTGADKREVFKESLAAHVSMVADWMPLHFSSAHCTRQTPLTDCIHLRLRGVKLLMKCIWVFLSCLPFRVTQKGSEAILHH